MANVDTLEAMERTQGRFETEPNQKPPIGFVLVKLASRCNINCTYCYWFRDADVYNRPSLLTLEAEDAFCRRLEQHIGEFGLNRFLLIFHGGEPLLFPKRRFVALQEKLLGIEERTGCRIDRAVCTNAILVDQEWARLLKRYDVGVSVSIDGPPEIHDRHRVDFKGNGTIADTLRGLENLREEGIEPGLISVCNPATDPEQVLAYAVEKLGIGRFDILPPDATHADNPPPIADYFIRLFDVWYDRYASKGVRIRTLDAMIHGLVGNFSVSDTIGLGPTDTVTLMPDGALEPLDVLRIAGHGSTKTNMSVFKNAIQDVQDDPRWSEAFQASLHLCETCKSCEFLDSCGGGHVAHRWSNERRFDNPSVYCDSWKRIFEHVWRRISPTLTIEYGGPRMSTAPARE
ncbi:radical SAM protein [Bradyrhizobium sp. WSM 1704]|uniref:radical SAM protein n=1 Tax=Bradyrhizobium semiaridum TaxID=2821404 RepID=UPI001CE237BA|nr:radical SAM protein [Bradyrhizobium semiaridum]MCA6120325.1 radical SAM protein [Bradyrhizobium semiaridum]